MRSFIVALAVALLPTSAAAQSSGQQGGNIDLQAFRPAIDSRGFITLNASQVLGHGELSFGIVTNWGRNVLRFERADQTYEVDNILSPTLVGAYGLRVGKLELEVGASVPFIIVSGDRSPDDDGGTTPPNDDRNFQFEGQGLGDVGLHAKLRIFNTSRGPRIGLAVIGSVYMPTASEQRAWLGEDGWTPQASVIVDREWAGGDVHVAANLGVRHRTGDSTFTDDAATRMMDPGMPTTGETITVGSTIPFGAGVAYALAPGRFDLVVELFGEVPLDGENYFPLEALGGVKLYLARNSFLTLGGGVGLLDSMGGNPDVRAFLGIVFEPNIGDRDGDGLKDDVDHCPDDPEDFDDFEDRDGCPELDNDRDTILDTDDRCPNQPEDKDGIEDDDGCPETDRVDRDGDRIVDELDACPDDPEDYDDWPVKDVGGELVVFDKIHFEYNKAIIKEESHPILDAVAFTIVNNPDIRRVEVQGHTDERGSDRYNLDLSQRRAEAVVKYLEDYGIDASRLRPKGYGERDPIDESHNEQAWAVNRRVEFLIRDRD